MSPLPPPRAVLTTPWRVTVIALLLAYLVLAGAHLSITPVAPDSSQNYINAPDEAAHLAYVRIISQGRLPTRADGAETYEWHQPPLYYLAASAFLGYGAHAIRWFSVLLGLGGLGLILAGARRLFPNDPPLAVLAMGFAALLPMRQAITAAVGNDGLTEVCFSLFLVSVIRAFHSGFTARRAIDIGFALAMALLTKASGMLLVPVLLLTLWLLIREGENRRSVAQGAIILFAVALLASGWWYARNMTLYHEPTPIKTFTREFAGTAKASDFIGRGEPPMARTGYLGWVASWTWQTFWAAWTPPGRPASVGMPFMLPAPFYVLCGLLAVGALAGQVWLHFRRRGEFTSQQRHVIGILQFTLLLVALSFVGFVWTFFQAQGRYLYPAMLPLSVLFALGFRCPLPDRYRDAATWAALALLLVLSVAFLVAGVSPAYS